MTNRFKEQNEATSMLEINTHNVAFLHIGENADSNEVVELIEGFAQRKYDPLIDY